jgi:hypothetical protein
VIFVLLLLCYLPQTDIIVAIDALNAAAAAPADICAAAAAAQEALVLPPTVALCEWISGSEISRVVVAVSGGLPSFACPWPGSTTLNFS